MRSTYLSLLSVLVISTRLVVGRTDLQPPPVPRQLMWGQCGADGWFGTARCVEGAKCERYNIDYSQCIPGTPTPIPLPTAPVKVLAIGDTITSGASGNSYLATLKDFLSQDGIAIDFIGTQECGTDECEAYPGASVDEIGDYAKEALAQQPNIVLVHLGVKEVTGTEDITAAGERLKVLLTTIWGIAPDTTILFGELPPLPSVSLPSRVSAWNGRIMNAIRYPNYMGERVLNVPMALTNVTAVDIGEDGIHPTQGGYDKVAGAWYIGYHYARDRGWVP